MKLPVKRIDIRFSVHATEDPEKAKDAVLNLLPVDVASEVIFEKRSLRGHYGNPIILLQAFIVKKHIIRAFVEKLSASLGKMNKERILKNLNLFVDRNSLYLRFDKQSAFQGKLKLQTSDPIYIRIRFQKSNYKSIFEICQDLGLVS